MNNFLCKFTSRYTLTALFCCVFLSVLNVQHVYASENSLEIREFEPYYYGGAGLSYTFVHPESADASVFSVSDDEDTGFRLHAGYHWRPLWSFDIMYADLGEAAVKSNALGIDVGSVGYTVPAIHANFHVEQDYVSASIFTKAGLSFLNPKESALVTVEKKHAAQIMTGIGAVKYFKNDWGVRGDIDFYSRDAAAITIGIQKAFRPKYIPPAPLDSDNDGVIDDLDQCPETIAGVIVDEVGCEIPPEPTVEEVVEQALAVIDLKGVNFEVNSDKLTEASKVILDEAAIVLVANESVKLDIEAHSDSDGSAKYNLKLSDKRANSVKDYLVGAGVAVERLSAEGFGESAPIADNATAEGKAKNRRVEFKIIQEEEIVEPSKELDSAEGSEKILGEDASDLAVEGEAGE